jgi:transglutaminase-like putative cysteine protease
MRKRDFPTLLLYVLSFLLLWEWLRPIEQLTDTDNIEVFILFLLVSLALSYLKLKWIWKFIIKSCYILIFLHHFYYEGSLFQFSWLSSFIANVVNNVGLLAARNWGDLSDEFRSFLFFILLWLMVYLIQYWLLRQQQIFIFFFMTLIYITVLDTFTNYEAKFSIVRTVVAGFTVMGMLAFYRILQREQVDSSPAFLKKWMVPLAGMIVFSVVVGIVSPKAAPIWPDPVPYLKAVKEGAGTTSGLGPHRIGYGTNDDRLGGPFIGDDSTVFLVEATGKHYWKVETKDIYTGKGWIPSGSTPIEFREGDFVPVYSIPGTVERLPETAKILPAETKHPLIVYPAGVQKLRDIKPVSPYEGLIQIDTTVERIKSFETEAYTVDFSVPKYKIEDLRKATGFNSREMGLKFYQRYTLLPKNLPPRIKQLTEEITKGKKNWFDKAQAVEDYFGRNDYTYDQKKVALPGKDIDYVDQFLFETKRGYCDNFSTSMAVMLRTIGIPTRWVKGFTGGEFMKYNLKDGTKRVYKVTNNNAHSWVEVFLPNQGWIPFEPTKGFTNEIRIDYGSNTSTSNTQRAEPAPVQKPKVPPKEDSKQTSAGEKGFDFKLVWLKWKFFFKANWKWFALSLTGLAALIGILYRIRGKWVPYLLLLHYRFKKNDETIGKAYLILLRQLERYGLKRQKNQTLRNYARYVDQFFSTREMTRLTSYYEQYLYHKDLPEGGWQETRKLWENLIKRTIA